MWYTCFAASEQYSLLQSHWLGRGRMRQVLDAKPYDQASYTHFFTASILITLFAPQMLEHGGFSAGPFMQLAASEPKPLCTHLLFWHKEKIRICFTACCLRCWGRSFPSQCSATSCQQLAVYVCLHVETQFKHSLVYAAFQLATGMEKLSLSSFWVTFFSFLQCQNHPACWSLLCMRLMNKSKAVPWLKALIWSMSSPQQRSFKMKTWSKSFMACAQEPRCQIRLGKPENLEATSLKPRDPRLEHASECSECSYSWQIVSLLRNKYGRRFPRPSATRCCITSRPWTAPPVTAPSKNAFKCCKRLFSLRHQESDGHSSNSRWLENSTHKTYCCPRAHPWKRRCCGRHRIPPRWSTQALAASHERWCTQALAASNEGYEQNSPMLYMFV